MRKKGVEYAKIQNKYSLDKFRLHYEKVGEVNNGFSCSFQDAPIRVNRLVARVRRQHINTTTDRHKQIGRSSRAIRTTISSNTENI